MISRLAMGLVTTAHARVLALPWTVAPEFLPRPYLLVADLIECSSCPWHVKMCTMRFEPDEASRVP